MVERNVGQMSLADGLVEASRSILDEVEAVVDWTPLRALLGKRGGDGAGNSSYPAEVLLRCLLVGIWHNLSDPALEAAIADRLSFRRFVGLSLHDRTPDHSTLWRFRQELAQGGLVDQIQVQQARIEVGNDSRGTERFASFGDGANRAPALHDDLTDRAADMDLYPS